MLENRKLLTKPNCSSVGPYHYLTLGPTVVKMINVVIWVIHVYLNIDNLKFYGILYHVIIVINLNHHYVKTNSQYHIPAITDFFFFDNVTDYQRPIWKCVCNIFILCYIIRWYMHIGLGSVLYLFSLEI